MDCTIKNIDMRKASILSLLLILNNLVGWTQGFLSITRDTSVQGKYHLFEREIYQGGQLSGQMNFILIQGDTIMITNLHSSPCGINEDLTDKKLDYAKSILNTPKIYFNIPSDKILKDTSWLYDSSGNLRRYFTDVYNTAIFDSARIANGFKIVIPSTPVLYYASDDLRILTKYYDGINENDYQILILENGLQFAIPKNDKSHAYFTVGQNRLALVDPVQDSALLAGRGIYYDGSMWEINSTRLEFAKLILILFTILLALGVVALTLFLEKYPVFAVYDGSGFASFAAAFGTTNKFIIKSNKAFHGVNPDNPSEKRNLKDILAGSFLLVDKKNGFSLGKVSRNSKKPVYCRINNNLEDIASFCDKIKIRQSDLKALNPQVFRRKKYTVTTDYLIGYTYKNRTPHNLEELLDSLSLSYGDPVNPQKLSGMSKYQQAHALKAGQEPGTISQVQSGPYADQKSIAGHFDEIWKKISLKLADIELKLGTVESRINNLDEGFNQKNKGKPSVDMSFFKQEAQNTSYCLNRLDNIEKDLINYVAQFRSEDVELQYFLNSTISRFLSKQITIKGKQAFWIPLIDAINGNLGLAHEDMVYKNLAEDISQFSNPLDKATYLNRQLFNDLWNSSLSNMLVMLEELRNTGSFLKQTVDGNTLSELKGFAEQNIESVFEIARSLDLKITYIPLFAQYENFNLKDLDIDIFTSFNYFYNNVRSKLEKNHIVQILSYGITSFKTDRSTKTKIRIMP